MIGLAFGGVRSVRRGIGSDIASSREYRPATTSRGWTGRRRRGSRPLAPTTSSSCASASPTRRRASSSSATGARRCRSRPRALRKLDKPRALLTALELIGASAHAARSLTGYVDHADGETYWRPPRSERLAEPGTFDRPFHAPADTVSRGLELLGDHRRDLPTQAFVFVLSDFLVPPDMDAWQRALEHMWELVPVVIQDPDVGAELPRRRRRHRRLRRAGDAAASSRSTSRAARRGGCATSTRRAGTSSSRDFRSLGIEPVVVDSHDYADMLAAFLRWADLRLMWRGAVA